MKDSAPMREELVGALRLYLIGPGAGHALARERLPGWVRPSNWYLTGFLVPRGAPLGQRGERIRRAARSGNPAGPSAPMGLRRMDVTKCPCVSTSREVARAFAERSR